MLAASIPSKFQVPFANGAGPSFTNPIPLASQIGINSGRASLTDGFVPLNFTPIASGGVPPFGADFNGLLNQITAWNQWQAAGGPIPYDATFQTAIGGYPNGAIVRSNIVTSDYWQSTVDNNSSNPDTGGANWINPPGMLGTGEWKFQPSALVMPGWTPSNGNTVGNAISSANGRANADCLFVFQYFWNNYSNTQCPVSGGRGANATADFNANKTIATFDMRSTGISGVDGMGNVGGGNGLYTGVPIVSGSAILSGSIIGENLHTLINAELSVHNHTLTDNGHGHNISSTLTGTGGSKGVIEGAGGGSGTIGGGGSFGPPATWAIVGNTTGITLATAGSGAAHNNVARNTLVTWWVKL